MISLIAAIIIVVSIIAELSIKAYRKERNAISIKDSIELYYHPIMPLYCNGKRLNFLIDTGSSNSFIDPNSLKNVPFEPLVSDSQMSVSGITGDKMSFDLCAMNMEYKDLEFSYIFGIMEVSGRLNEMTEGSINIDGIVGSDFLAEYGYIIDYNDQIVYVK